MKASNSKWLIAGTIVLAALILVTGTALIAWIFFRPFISSDPFNRPDLGLFTDGYESNGEQIYYTGTSETGPPIIPRMGGMHPMQPGAMGCVSCHGENGEGGTVRMMMMGTFEAPNIQYGNLIEGEHGDDHEGHPPYTEETLKQAITEGIDPAGEPLDGVMPRWEMTGEQLTDLVEYLKTLD